MHRGRVIEYFEKRFAHMVRISRSIQRCSMPQTMYRKPAVRSVLLFDGNVENIFNRHSHQRMTAPGKTRRNMPYNICFLQSQMDLQVAVFAAGDKTASNRLIKKMVL